MLPSNKDNECPTPHWWPADSGAWSGGRSLAVPEVLEKLDHGWEGREQTRRVSADRLHAQLGASLAAVSVPGALWVMPGEHGASLADLEPLPAPTTPRGVGRNSESAPLRPPRGE